MRAFLAFSCLAFLLFSATLPAAAQQGEPIVFEEITVLLTSEVFTAHFVGDHHTAAESNMLRNYIDREHGDEDGVVTQDEVDDFVAATIREMNRMMEGLAGAVLFGGIRIGASVEDARASVTRTVTDIRYSEEVLGPVASDEEVVRELDARLTFADTPRTRLTVVFADDFRRPFAQQEMAIEWQEAVFRGAAPWAIDPATIEPESVRDAFFAGGAFHVPFDEMGAFSSASEPLSFEIADTTVETIEPEDGDGRGSPAPALLLVLLAVLALAAARRPRRRS